MKITRIAVSRSRKFNHALEDFSNIQISITLDAALEDGERRCDVAATLNEQARDSLDREESWVRAGWQAQQEAETSKEREVDTLCSTIKTALGRLRELDSGIDGAWLAAQVDPDIPF